MSELFRDISRALNPAINDQHPRGSMEDKIAFLNSSAGWRDIFIQAGLIGRLTWPTRRLATGASGICLRMRHKSPPGAYPGNQ
jgi:hypothetical protein